MISLYEQGSQCQGDFRLLHSVVAVAVGVVVDTVEVIVVVVDIVEVVVVVVVFDIVLVYT